MKQIDQLAKLDTIRSAQTDPDTAGSPGKAHIDAISQVFAEFELAYHNQYRKAYPDASLVVLAKKYWLNCLAPFAPELILKAARELVKTQTFLPTIANMVEMCRNGMSLFGLPTAHEAYLQACRAPSPKAQQEWRHPAVYLAGKATGWFELANQPEALIYPLFEYHYSQLMQQVLRGEELIVSTPTPIPQNLSAPLSNKENQSRLQQLKKTLKL